MNVSVSKKAVDFIFDEETGGRAYYEKFCSHPIWPKGSSGITVGGGYDCGYYSADQIKKDWGGLISDESLKLLQSVAGLKGQRAQNALTSKLVSGVYISYDVAYKQYMERVIKHQLRVTVKGFPGSETFNPGALGFMTSVVYNRGTDITDNDVKAEDRREMRLIKALVPKKDYKGIAVQIRSMKRLWDGVPDYVGDHEVKFTGLLGRRDKEAVGMENSERVYDPSELITFDI